MRELVPTNATTPEAIMEEIARQDEAIRLLLAYARSITRMSSGDAIKLSLISAVNQIQPHHDVAVALEKALRCTYQKESPWPKGFMPDW